MGEIIGKWTQTWLHGPNVQVTRHSPEELTQLVAKQVRMTNIYAMGIWNANGMHWVMQSKSSL